MIWLSEYSNSIPGEYMLVPPAIDISMESGEASAEASHVFISLTYLAIPRPRKRHQRTDRENILL